MPWTHKAVWITPLAIGVLLLLSSVAVSRGLLRRVYDRKLAESRRERLFLASTGYFTAALVVRGITLAIHYNIGPFHDVSMHGRHIHHLVWGILLLLVVGYGWLLQAGTGAAWSNVWAARAMCMGYGVGAALTLDEFALWLNLRERLLGEGRPGKFRGDGGIRRRALHWNLRPPVLFRSCSGDWRRLPGKWRIGWPLGSQAARLHRPPGCPAAFSAAGTGPYVHPIAGAFGGRGGCPC